MPRASPSLGTLAGPWALDGVGDVSFVPATIEHCKAVDASWPNQRRDTDLHKEWRWSLIRSNAGECFVALVGGEPAALWSAQLIQLPSGRFYRLDNVEVAPMFRGTILSPFVLSAIAYRAVDHLVVGMLLTAFRVDGVVNFYLDGGARHEVPTDWPHDETLVPLSFDESALRTLRGQMS